MSLGLPLMMVVVGLLVAAMVMVLGSPWLVSSVSVAWMAAMVPGGVVHELPEDLRDELVAHPTALAAWHDITPLARNEFICWVEDAKQAPTRARRIRRTREELDDGMRRPCCWPGCAHRERNGR